MIVCQLGRIPYSKALTIQNNIVQRVQNKEVGSTVLICEHYPVYTFGRRQTIDKSLSKIADVVKIQRGGQATYHGPGQLVVYPIIDLKSIDFGVRQFVESLELGIIQTLKGFRIIGHTTRNNGVFVDDKKVASVGIHVQRFVTCHGFALNVNRTVLPWFEKIVPCGLDNVQTTCIESVSSTKVDLVDLSELLVKDLLHLWKVPISRTKSL